MARRPGDAGVKAFAASVIPVMLAAATMTVLLAPSVAAVPAPLRSPVAVQVEPIPRQCANEISDARARGVDVSRIAEDGIVIVGGRSIPVSGPDAQWRQRDERDPTWTTRFHGMSWAVVAALEGIPAVDLVLERRAALPDPGAAVGIAELQATGWTESAVRLRQATVNCLYLITGDQRLIPIVEELAQANLDPVRYWGLPLNPVHNHGILANIVMLESAEVFGRGEWRDQALRRLDADSGRVFAACGMTAEQSTHYHLVNVRLWSRLLRDLPASPDAPVAQAVAERIGTATIALARLARPDGIIEAIGDGFPLRLPRDVAVEADPDPRLWCRQRGWAANRTSWDDSLVHYTLRFGPRPRFHGHLDQGSITWFAGGVPVFSDRGYYDTTRDDRSIRGRSAAYHSVFEPIGVTSRSVMTGRRMPSEVGDEYALTWSQDGIEMERVVTIPLSETSLRVLDTGLSPDFRWWAQHWQLAPGWTPLPRRSIADPAAVHESGLYLYGACSSRGFNPGRAVPVEAYPKRREVVPAWSLTCERLGARVRMETLWVVSDVSGRFRWDPVAGTYEITAPAPLP